MKRTAQILLPVALFSLLGVLPARADPVTVTGGYLLATGYSVVSPPSTITGSNGFSATGELDIGHGTGLLIPMELCRFDPLACPPGAPVPLTGFMRGHGVDPGFSRAVVTLDGVEYRDFGEDDPNRFVLELAGSAVLPSFADGSSRTVTAPFTLAGEFFNGMTTTELVGAGVATLWISPAMFDDFRYWWIDQARYDFTDTAPIPEPATLLLVGTGLAGIARVRARRRRSHAI